MVPILWSLCSRFACVLVVSLVFTFSLWAAVIEHAEYNRENGTVHLRLRHWDWPEYSVMLPIAVTLLADQVLWTWTTRNQVVVGNVVEGGTIDCSIGKTIVY